MNDYVHANGPFDGILGFSQGASMAHLLLAMEQLGEVKLGFRFAIFFSSFLSLSSVHDSYTKMKLSIPSLHVYGSNDQVVAYTNSEKLRDMFSDSVSIVHDGGHFIPTMTKYKDVAITFFERFITEQ